MSVTRRFAFLAAGGIPLLAMAALMPASVTALAFWLYNLILFGLLVMDFFLSPSAAGFEIRRINTDQKLSHQALNLIAFNVYNPSSYKLYVEALDIVSGRHFEVSGENLKHGVGPREEKTFSYSLIPSKRGAFSFSHIHLRLRGLLGLCVKYHSHLCPMEVKVYPNMSDLSRFRLMTQKNRLLPKGEKTIRLYGPGTEFESLRAYVEGDDYRKINWPVTAREMRLIVNDYQTEKNQPVFIMIDGGRPMSYSIKGYKKLDYAINAALVLSDIVNQKGDQSGLLVFDTEVRSLIMPGKGQAHRSGMMEALYHIQETRSTSNYKDAFQTLCRRQKRRSLVFIFTDFETLEEARELCGHMAQLKRRHFPVVVFMKNEKLTELSVRGNERAKGQKYVQEVAQAFLAERRQLFRTLNAMSIPNVETEAENFSVAAVNRYLAFRKI